jgi:hypothetical protein
VDFFFVVFLAAALLGVGAFFFTGAFFFLPEPVAEFTASSILLVPPYIPRNPAIVVIS